MLGISPTMAKKKCCPEAFTREIRKADVKKKHYYPTFSE